MTTTATVQPRNRTKHRAVAAGANLAGAMAKASLTPRYITIADWRTLTGMSRSATYRALTEGQLVAIKRGTRTLIDATAGLAWLNGLPRAEFRKPAQAA